MFYQTPGIRNRQNYFIISCRYNSYVCHIVCLYPKGATEWRISLLQALKQFVSDKRTQTDIASITWVLLKEPGYYQCDVTGWLCYMSVTRCLLLSPPFPPSRSSSYSSPLLLLLLPVLRLLLLLVVLLELQQFSEVADLYLLHSLACELHVVMRRRVCWALANWKWVKTMKLGNVSYELNCYWI